MTISLDRMELDDYREPKRMVAEICRQNPDMSLPVPLEALAAAAGIKDVHYRQLDGMAGAMVADELKNEGIILIKDDDPPRRQRFTFGHELGHFLLPHHGYKQYCSPDDMRTLSKNKKASPQARIEFEANTFSSELLMPKRQFCTQPEFRRGPSLEAVTRLKELFDVSFQACAHRYVKMSGYAIAMVFSLNGIVRYAIRSPDFPFWIKPNGGDTLPPGTISKRSVQDKADSFYDDSTDADCWIGEARGFEFPEELIEYVLVQRDGYMVTLLWCEDGVEEVEE